MAGHWAMKSCKKSTYIFPAFKLSANFLFVLQNSVDQYMGISICVKVV